MWRNKVANVKDNHYERNGERSAIGWEFLNSQSKVLTILVKRQKVQTDWTAGITAVKSRENN